MNSTSATSTRDRTARATAAIALQVVAEHMVDQGLPVPSLIVPPSISNPDLTVWIRLEDLEPWTTSGVTLGRQEVREITSLPGNVRVTAAASILSPIGDVRFALTWAEPKTPLQAVRS